MGIIGEAIKPICVLSLIYTEAEEADYTEAEVPIENHEVTPHPQFHTRYATRFYY
ncbi:hypothetical protein KYTH41_09370 [Helicobacter pylori]